MQKEDSDTYGENKGPVEIFRIDALGPSSGILIETLTVRAKRHRRPIGMICSGFLVFLGGIIALAAINLEPPPYRGPIVIAPTTAPPSAAPTMPVTPPPTPPGSQPPTSPAPTITATTPATTMAPATTAPTTPPTPASTTLAPTPNTLAPSGGGRRLLSDSGDSDSHSRHLLQAPAPAPTPVIDQIADYRVSQWIVCWAWMIVPAFIYAHYKQYNEIFVALAGITVFWMNYAIPEIDHLRFLASNRPERMYKAHGLGLAFEIMAVLIVILSVAPAWPPVPKIRTPYVAGGVAGTLWMVVGAVLIWAAIDLEDAKVYPQASLDLMRMTMLPFLSCFAGLAAFFYPSVLTRGGSLVLLGQAMLQTSRYAFFIDRSLELTFSRADQNVAVGGMVLMFMGCTCVLVLDIVDAIKNGGGEIQGLPSPSVN